MSGSKMQFWRDPMLGQRGTDLLIARDTNHRYSRHFHEEYVVSIFETGAQRHQIGNRQSVATAGHLVLIRPGEPHSGEPGDADGSWSHRAFYPDADTLHGIADALFSGPRLRDLDFPATPLLDDVRTNERIAALHAFVCDVGRDTMDREQAFADAMELVLLRYARAGRGGRRIVDERAAVNFAIACMHDHLDKPDLSINDLAEAAGLSPFYFMRSFRKSTGMTAHNYLIQLRLHAARDRLANDLPAADVAIECGFFDQSHLIRHFQKAYGVTPGRYQARALNA